MLNLCARGLFDDWTADIVQQITDRFFKFARHLEIAVSTVVSEVAVADMDHPKFFRVVGLPDQHSAVLDALAANIAERAEAVESVDVDHFNHGVAAFQEMANLCFRFPTPYVMNA